MNKLLKKVIALGLSAALCLTGAGFAFADDGVKNEKDETVYVLAGADGAVRQVIVSDWLKNAAGEDALADRRTVRVAHVLADGAGLRVGDRLDPDANHIPEGAELFVETFQPPLALWIFGAGEPARPLAELADRQIGRLSLGQLQRVLVARALAVEPEMLVLDEPTASLDPGGGADVYRILEELSKEMTILLVSHDLGVVSTLVSSVACVNQKLYYHGQANVSREVFDEAYGCPVGFVTHQHTHLVLEEHRHA